MKIYKKFNSEQLRKKDFSKFITTPIRVINGKSVTLCPFHAENTPSFYIYPDNHYFCFGCHAQGNAIDFVMRKLGYSFTHACEVLEAL